MSYGVSALLTSWLTSHQVTIESVSDEVLLNIFRYVLDVSPRSWPRLVHTCRQWRHFVFASQGALRLRLFFTPGTPVQKSLHYWPVLPIVVQYGGSLALSQPTLEDEDNIMAALKHSDRVISISLAITTSLLKKLSTLAGVFSELQDLVLLSRDDVLLTIMMPSAFRWGQRLRRLHSTGIAFPALLQLLSSSKNLIDLQLHEVFLPWQFSPALLMKALSKLGHLRSLSLHFCSAVHYHSSLPPYLESIFLPVLTRLNYQGNMEYLEDILASIDAPFLEDVEIIFFDHPILALSKLNGILDQIEIYRSHFGAHILSSEPTITISLTQPGTPTCLKLQLLCKPIRVQICSMAQICLDFSSFLINNKRNLLIGTTRPPGRMDSSHSRELMELLNPFAGKSCFISTQ